MDGCYVHRIFFRIVLPMTSSVISTTAIINMIYNWNEFIFVNTFISTDSYKTLTEGPSTTCLKASREGFFFF
ncbi:sugar ABC transporter permease [Paenibacillus amylolyticus]|uniref:Sugar ABC transporter permease n=1 Tax=Paenibacillus amylolyticus TaxID=1451 RepID=A0A100VQU1_PAEAM|nr:sugar ABC transporter permease [Paenibacillus amylolyticus]